MNKRSSGVLLHLTSLPTPFGVGDLGPAAYRYIDWLKSAGFTSWQVLPLGVTNETGCPYASYSAFGGNPILISPQVLVDDGLLDEGLLDTYAVSKNNPGSDVNYSTISFVKHSLFRQAYVKFQKRIDLIKEFEIFCNKNYAWLDDLAIFLALTNNYGSKWWKWPKGLRKYDSDEVNEFCNEFASEIEFYEFLQFIFDRQWQKLRNYAHKKGIDIIGDIPIFVSHHSMDVWKHPEFFKLKANGDLQFESGAAPDMFCKTGQMWGTPVYKWHVLEKDHYSWWIKRVAYTLSQVDLVRLDHFRGFAAVWEVPVGSPDATGGKWVKGPGKKLFDAILKDFGSLPFIVEDLGAITEDVVELRDHFNLPGMKVLQFAFTSDETNENLPENITENFVVYTGTHDMDTINGRYWDMKKINPERIFAMDELGIKSRKHEVDFSWPMIEMCLSSKAKLAIIPMQDILGLDNSARMNVPGTTDGNWKWRFNYDLLDSYANVRLLSLNKLTKRVK